MRSAAVLIATTTGGADRANEFAIHDKRDAAFNRNRAETADDVGSGRKFSGVVATLPFPVFALLKSRWYHATGKS